MTREVAGTVERPAPMALSMAISELRVLRHSSSWAARNVDMARVAFEHTWLNGADGDRPGLPLSYPWPGDAP